MPWVPPNAPDRTPTSHDARKASRSHLRARPQGRRPGPSPSGRPCRLGHYGKLPARGPPGDGTAVEGRSLVPTKQDSILELGVLPGGSPDYHTTIFGRSARSSGTLPDYARNIGDLPFLGFPSIRYFWKCHVAVRWFLSPARLTHPTERSLVFDNLLSSYGRGTA